MKREAMILALLGYPLAHSLSPAMHNAALAAVGLHDWRYEAMPVEAQGLAGAVARLRRSEYAGANVTVPHKQAVIPLLDGLTPVAAAIGAVNTLFKPRGPLPGSGGEVQPRAPLMGHNTDAAGLLADLYAHGVKLEHRTVLILGAGGAARAAAAACAGFGARLRIIARRPVQTQAFETC
ncbi:MAG: hypothetical protein HY784_15680, partial [Chloroflexi bacterium]|nr:hypothetical protein [Chloroflexota bacterium]